MPPEYIAALKAFAFQGDVSLAEYVRGMAYDEILKKGASFRERGASFRALISTGEAWVMDYHQCVAVAGGLPGKERRTELERLTWEAAKNERHRMLAIQAIALITRAEEEILADMDKAEADQIVRRIEAASNVMYKAAGHDPTKTARSK